jgi:glycosyltransferase involved in cell wall biosynthesis
MHILILSRIYPTDLSPKVGNFVKNQAEALSEHRIKIGVFGIFSISMFRFLKIRNLFKIGFRIFKKDNIINYFLLLPVIPKLYFINNQFKYLLGKILIKRYFKKNGMPDIVHLHFFETGKLAVYLKRKYGIKYIVTEHSTLFYMNLASNWQIKIAQKVYQESSYNIAVSKEFAINLQKRFNVEFNYLPNFVNVRKFKLKSKHGESDKVRFINIAYLDKKKNQKLLIDSFTKVYFNNDKYELLIVGDGPEKKNLENQIKLSGSNNINLFGYADYDTVVNLLQNSDYFVLSSDFETFGVVIIEAMSCGLPVISTKSGGPESIIIDEKLGILCKKGDIIEFSDALKRIVANNYDSKYIRNYATENFSYEFLSEKLIEKYTSLIEE